MKSNALIGWEVEVKLEVERLIGLGEPPWVAAEQAVRNVRRKRRAEAAKAASERFLDHLRENAQCQAGFRDYANGNCRNAESFVDELDRELN